MPSPQEADLVGHLVSRFILQDTRKRRSEREAWVRRGATSVIAANNPCHLPPGDPSCIPYCIAITTNGDVRYSGYTGERPDDIPGPFVAVAMGIDHSLALRANGDVHCWGNNDWGEAPRTVQGPFLAVAGGMAHSVALHANGDAHCWGRNDWGQAPRTVQGPFLAVGAGELHSIGLCENGDIQCWGNAQLCSFLDDGPIPLTLKIPGPFVAIDAVDERTAGLRPNGTIEVYGSWPAQWPMTPREFRGSFVAFSLGRGFLLALDKEGDLEVFGVHRDLIQTSFRAKGPFVAIAAGDYHSQALRADGTIQSWGRVDEAGPNETFMCPSEIFGRMG